MDKEDIEATIWRLQHFINDGVGYDVPKDIRTLIAHIAELEEEIDDLKEAAVPRTVDGDGSDLPAGTVVIDNAGDAWQKGDDGYWDLATFHANFSGDLEAACVPYTIVYTPKGGES